jgi:hypothetical protein
MDLSRMFKHNTNPYIGYGGLNYHPRNFREAIGGRMYGGMLPRQELIKYTEKVIPDTFGEQDIAFRQHLIQSIEDNEINTMDDLKDELFSHIIKEKSPEEKKALSTKRVSKILNEEEKELMELGDEFPLKETRGKKFILHELKIIDDEIGTDVGSGERFEGWFENKFNHNKIKDLPISGGILKNTKTLTTLTDPKYCIHDTFTKNSSPINAIIELKCYSGSIMKKSCKLTLTKFEGNPKNYIPLYYKTKNNQVRFWNAITSKFGKIQLVYPEQKNGYEMLAVFKLGDGLFYYDLTQDETIKWTDYNSNKKQFFDFYILGGRQSMIDINNLISSSGKSLLYFETNINLKKNDGCFVEETMRTNYGGVINETKCLKINSDKLKTWRFEK